MKPPRELSARALCRLAGNPEDTKFEGRPMWESYLPEADAALSAAGIVLALKTDERLALRRFASETGEELDAAAHIAIREFLIGIGMLELPEGDQ
jgi:hypothetical protein